MAGLTWEVEIANRAPVLFSALTLDLDITFILVLALLLLPLLILNGLVFGPFMKLFAERHEKLQGALERAKAQLDDAEDKGRAFEAKMKEAAARGTEVRNQIRNDTQREMNSRIEAEKARLAGKLEVAKGEVRQARAEAMSKVDQDAKRLAEATAAKLLGRAI
jgi:F-type H+-transporting ATPase subunit b